MPERPPNETRKDKFKKGGARSNDCSDETATTATSEFQAMFLNHQTQQPQAMLAFLEKVEVTKVLVVIEEPSYITLLCVPY